MELLLVLFLVNKLWKLYLKKGIRVDKRKLQLEQSIASLGVTRVPVDLYRGQVIGEIVVHVSEKA